MPTVSTSSPLELKEATENGKRVTVLELKPGEKFKLAARTSKTSSTREFDFFGKDNNMSGVSNADYELKIERSGGKVSIKIIPKDAFAGELDISTGNNGTPKSGKVQVNGGLVPVSLPKSAMTYDIPKSDSLTIVTKTAAGAVIISKFSFNGIDKDIGSADHSGVFKASFLHNADGTRRVAIVPASGFKGSFEVNAAGTVLKPVAPAASTPPTPPAAFPNATSPAPTPGPSPANPKLSSPPVAPATKPNFPKPATDEPSAAETPAAKALPFSEQNMTAALAALEKQYPNTWGPVKSINPKDLGPSIRQAIAAAVDNSNGSKVILNRMVQHDEKKDYLSSGLNARGQVVILDKRQQLFRVYDFPEALNRLSSRQQTDPGVVLKNNTKSDTNPSGTYEPGVYSTNRYRYNLRSGTFMIK